MVIINGTAHDPIGRERIECEKQHLHEILNNLNCPNECKKDFLIRLQWHEKKSDIQVQIYGACCKDFEKEIKPYLRPFLK